MAPTKPRPLPDALLAELARAHGTPLFVYDAPTIRARVSQLRGRFDRVRYAQKANPNRALLELVRAEGCVVDAVSAGEAEGALAAGFRAEDVTFTSDLFDHAGLECVARHRLPVNLGSADMLEQYAALGAGRAVTLRINPGFGGGHAPGVTTGGEHSKHGIWHADLEQVLARARALGLEVTGLHLHVGSGAGLETHLRAADALKDLALRVGPGLTTISAGGGLPIPYRPDEPRLDVEALARGWREARDGLARALGVPLALEVEPGRYLVAEAGLLVTEVRATKRNGTQAYALVDAGFHNLPRPLLYGARTSSRAIPAGTPSRASCRASRSATSCACTTSAPTRPAWPRTTTASRSRRSSWSTATTSASSGRARRWLS